MTTTVCLSVCLYGIKYTLHLVKRYWLGLRYTATAMFNILKILRSAHKVYLCVLCGSENKQRLFPYTALTDWFV